MTPIVLIGLLGVPAIPADAVPAQVPPVVVAANVLGADAVQTGQIVAAGAAADGPVATLEQVTGFALLDRIDSLSHSDLGRFLDAHPGTINELLTRPPSAAEVAVWWESASQRSHANLQSLAPQLVGNLEGIPYLERDIANRTVLSDAQATLNDRLSGRVGRAERSELEARAHMLAEVERAVRGAGRRLVSLDVTGEGRAVVAIGDLASADVVTFLVPGMFFGVDAQIEAWTQTTQDLLIEQRSWLRRLHPSTSPSVAAVAWIGYATPNLINVASMESARSGREALTGALQGLRAARGEHQPFVSVVAHSYGSTAAMLSLSEDDVGVDALAVVGSPGSPARNAGELNAGSVWVGAADWDPISASGVFGSQPVSRAYGARMFSVAEGRDPVTGERLSGAVSHNDYFVPGSMALRNLALLSLGEGGLVVDADADRSEFARALTRVR